MFRNGGRSSPADAAEESRGDRWLACHPPRRRTAFIKATTSSSMMNWTSFTPSQLAVLRGRTQERYDPAHLISDKADKKIDKSDVQKVQG